MQRADVQWDAGRLAAELDLPSIALAPVLARLERGGLIVATEKEQFVPGRDPRASCWPTSWKPCAPCKAAG